MPKLNTVLKVGLIVACIILGIVISANFPQIAEIFRSPSAQVTSTRTIVNSIQGIGQLVTVTSTLDKADVRVEISGGFLNVGYYSASHLAIGAIEAGIDLSGIDEDSVSYGFGSNSITLTLPAPIITSCRIEHIDQYGGSFTLLPADWDVLRQLAQYEAISLFAQDMIEHGILDRAKDEATLRMGDFVSALTGRLAHIVFAESEGQPLLPISCQPELPNGWEKDPDGAWKRSG